MKKLFLISQLVMASMYVSASDVTSVNGLIIQMDNNNFTRNNDADVRLTLAYCLEQGAVGSALKYNSCEINKTDQKFNYENNRVISSSGACLTRTNQSKLTSLPTSSGWTNAISTTVAFTPCSNEDKTQEWQLRLTNNNYQLKALEEDTCLTFEASVGKVHSYPSGGTYSAHYAFVKLNSCSRAIAQLKHGDSPVMIIDRYIPIIIPM